MVNLTEEQLALLKTTAVTMYVKSLKSGKTNEEAGVNLDEFNFMLAKLGVGASILEHEAGLMSCGRSIKDCSNLAEEVESFRLSHEDQIKAEMITNGYNSFELYDDEPKSKFNKT